MAVKHYRELIAWQKAVDFVELVYRVSRAFPKEEMFGLTSQVWRSAVSVPSNIAEGQGRRTTREFLQFLSIARGSLQEVETQLILADRFCYFNEQDRCGLFDISAEVGRLISGLIKSLEELQECK